MKIKTLIIDDEPIALEKLKSYVLKVPFLELAGECHSAQEAINLLAGTDVDVVFTDISMPDLDGMEFASSLSRAPMIVFVTAHAQYAADSYRIAAVDYLLKPYGFADFQRAANRVLDLHTSRTRTPRQQPVQACGHIFVKTDYRYVRIDLDDIRYIKGYGEYLQIHTKGSAMPLLTLSSFAAIMERLPDNFLQVHRSYIVNMDNVERIEKSRIVMDSDTYLPIGDSYRATFQQYLNRHAVGAAGRKET